MVKCFLSASNDPHFNLALEHKLYTTVERNDLILYLWRNSSVVVIGRYQNPWNECNVEKMNRNQVKLMRRYSGGGAVFQDLGNLCFTLVSGSYYDSEIQKDLNNDFILTALHNLSIDAVASGRNDILVGEKKVSGAAFQVQKGCLMHHGTLLINTDLDGLQSYLNPSKYKLESKGIKSVRSRVSNLVEFNEKLDVNVVVEVLQSTYEQMFGKFDVIEVVGEEMLDESFDMRKEFDVLSSWDWLYGKTPEFTDSFAKRFPWGEIQLFLKVQNGVVVDVSVFTDSLELSIVDEIEDCLTGIQFSGSEVKNKLRNKALEMDGRVREQLLDVSQLML